MPALVNLSEFPVGPVRDKQEITIGSDDFTHKQGFVCEISETSGTNALIYRTMDGTTDQTETGLSVGDIIAVAGIPVLIKTVRSTSTVTKVMVGML